MTERKRRSPVRPGRPARPGREARPGGPGHPGGVRVRWEGFRPLFDNWGQEIPRYYQLETLARATERVLRGKDRFLAPSVQDTLGPSPVAAYRFELCQEGTYQLVFHVRASNVRRREESFAFVAAKRPGDYSALAEAEHGYLRMLCERAPDHVVRPFRGGWIYLPDRHNRPEHGRDIYAYVTQWLAGFDELGVAGNLQLCVNVKNRHLFSLAQTEELKAQMVEIIARTYHAASRDCMGLPEVASGDFMVSNPQRGPLRLKLIACRHILRNISPGRLVHRIVKASWDWGGRLFRLAPADPGLFCAGLVKARGGDEARAWLGEYLMLVRSGKVRASERLPVERLAEYLEAARG